MQGVFFFFENIQNVLKFIIIYGIMDYQFGIVDETSDDLN